MTDHNFTPNRDRGGRFASGSRPEADVEISDKYRDTEVKTHQIIRKHLDRGTIKKVPSLRGDSTYETGAQIMGWTDDGRRVTTNVRVSERSGTFMSVDHDEITNPHEVCLSGMTYKGRWEQGGGQNIEDLKAVTKFPNGVTADDRDAVVRLWEVNNLNTVNAGCSHQHREPGQSIDDVRPCEESGYKYGSAWLTKQANPEDIDAGLAAMEKFNKAGGQR